MKGIATQLAGDLRNKMLDTVTTPVMNAYDRLLESHDDKITDEADLPEEFKHYGEVLTPEQAAEEDALKASYDLERNELRRIDSLLRYVDAYVRFYRPGDGDDALTHCRDAQSNAQAYGMSEEVKSFIGEDVEQVCEDVQSFTSEEVTALVLRQYLDASGDVEPSPPAAS